MRALLVASVQDRAGRTGVAAAITQRLAYEGRRVLALRLGATGDPAANADAAYFSTLPGARERGGAPILATAAPSEVARLAGDSLPVVEADDAADLAAVANALDAAVIVVQRGPADDDAIMRLQNLALDLGPRLLGLVILAVPNGKMSAVEDAIEEAALPLLAAIPEDRLMYSPTIGEIADALQAEMLLGEDAEDLLIEEMLIGPVTADPAQPYYARRGNKAVITRSDKTDQQLAALASNTDCLILTGGLAPSPYTLDRASSDEVALMVTRSDTRATVERLGDMFGSSRFSSERKLDRMAELLRERLDWDVITSALA
jgi:uncharacterized protein